MKYSWHSSCVTDIEVGQLMDRLRYLGMILHDKPLYFVFLLPISLLAFKLKGSRMLEDIHLRRFEIKAENPLILLGFLRPFHQKGQSPGAVSGLENDTRVKIMPEMQRLVFFT